jgi:ribosomal protein S1
MVSGIPNAIDDLRDNLKTRITGMVTGTTEFGVFAEFNDCLTGLIPKDELTDSLDTYNSRGISAGDSISFWIKDIISNKKINSKAWQKALFYTAFCYYNDSKSYERGKPYGGQSWVL